MWKYELLVKPKNQLILVKESVFCSSGIISLGVIGVVRCIGVIRGHKTIPGQRPALHAGIRHQPAPSAPSTPHIHYLDSKA